MCACAGVRYMFVGKALEQRSSYRVLGVLLFLQLALSGSVSAATLLTRSFARDSEQSDMSPAASPSESGALDHSKQRRGHRIVLLDVSNQLLCNCRCFSCLLMWLAF